MNRFSILALILLLPLALSAAGESPPIDFHLEGETLHLDNGMTFVLIPLEGAPLFAGHISFKVGSVDTVPGNTGIAHMFEHMAFKGTTHIGTKDWEKEKPILDALREAGDRLTILRATGEGSPEEIGRLEEEVARLREEQNRYIEREEYDHLYDKAGSRHMNASTESDFTRYYVSLPANALELWMLIESQKIREPVLRDFYMEREVVFQERIQRFDNDPWGKLLENFVATAYISHPYRLTPIGWASDIRALTMEATEEFFRTYCAPSNAVGVLCGNFDVERATELIQRYFGTIPARPDPPQVVTREPPQETERRLTVAFGGPQMMLIGFHKPNWPNRDDLAMDIIQSILSDGRSARLHRSVVEGGKAYVAQALNGYPGTRYDNMFGVFSMPAQGTTYEELEALLYVELERLKGEPVSAEELERAKTRILAGYLRQLNHPEDMASLVATFQHITGDWKSIQSYAEELQTVKPEEIQAVAAKYFVPENRTVARLVPPPAPAEEDRP